MLVAAEVKAQMARKLMFLNRSRHRGITDIRHTYTHSTTVNIHRIKSLLPPQAGNDFVQCLPTVFALPSR